MRRRWSSGLAVIALCNLAWLDPHSTAREGNRLYAEGKYDEAAAHYNQALVDNPDSAALHFNLGDANYKQEKYDEALKAMQQVPASEDQPARAAHVAYNIGNAKYRVGAAAEASDPKTALSSYAEALVAYRRAMAVAPNEDDAKFNYEFVAKKLADLKKKLEEQQKEQEQKPQDQQDQRDQKDQQDQQDQKDEQQPQDQPGEQPPEKQPDQGEEPKPQEQPQQGADQPQPQPAEEGEPTDKAEDTMSPQEAAALLDAQRDQEVQPSDIVKQLQGGRVVVPAQDW